MISTGIKSFMSWYINSKKAIKKGKAVNDFKNKKKDNLLQLMVKPVLPPTNTNAPFNFFIYFSSMFFNSRCEA